MGGVGEAAVIAAVAVGTTLYSENRQRAARKDAQRDVEKQRRQVQEKETVRDAQSEQRRRRLLQLAGADLAARGQAGLGGGAGGGAAGGKTQLGL